MGSQSHNKFSSINQKITLYTNYLNNTVIYTVSYAYIIVVNEQRSSAISERFIFGKKTRMSFERITKTAISDTFICESKTFCAMMSENTDQKYTFIGMGNTNNEYIYQVNSKSDLTKVYTVRVKIVDDDLFDTNVHSIECECLGYTHRGKCWHSDMIMSAIDNNSYCIMCLTPFLDIQLKNSRAEVKAYDQDNNEILISKAGNMCGHKECLMNMYHLTEFGKGLEELGLKIYKSFFNNKPLEYSAINKIDFYHDDDEVIDK